MCIGLPMCTIEALPGCGGLRVRAVGRDGVREIDTRLVGPCRAGDWLLVFLDDARERLSAARAAEIDAVLDLLGDALAGAGAGEAAAPADPGFVLPSSLPLQQLQQWLGASANRAHRLPAQTPPPAAAVTTHLARDPASSQEPSP